MKLFNKSKDQFISQVVILSMIFGFAAGVVGQIVADVYINPYQQDFDYQNLNINSSVIPELKRVKTFLGIEQDFEVNASIEKVAPGLAGIYLKKSAGRNILNQIYLPQDLRANAFILTSDGWLVSASKVLENLDAEQLAVIHQGQIFPVEEIITDSVTGIAFLKIPASNLSVLVLGDSDEMILGQLAIVLNNLGEVVVTNIKNAKYSAAGLAGDLVLTSEEYGHSFLLAGGLNDFYLGSPLVNLGGAVVGVISGINEGGAVTSAVPINQFSPIILDVLRNSIIKRPFLGVSYLDLAWAVGLDQELTQGLDRGALVYQNPKNLTPAFDAGLKENDIILTIDGQPVDEDSSLTELIQQYRPGDEITLEILRQGSTISRTVNLVVLPD